MNCKELEDKIEELKLQLERKNARKEAAIEQIINLMEHVELSVNELFQSLGGFPHS